jgi:hypothetical protein
MQFEWDDNKNAANLKKHGISFDEAALIFKGIVLTRLDNREDYGETREISTGMIGGQTVVIVAHTDRSNAIRIISARLANKAEKKAYYDYYQKNTY